MPEVGSGETLDQGRGNTKLFGNKGKEEDKALEGPHLGSQSHVTARLPMQEVLPVFWEGGEVLPGPPGLICSLTGSPISGRQ